MTGFSGISGILNGIAPSALLPRNDGVLDGIASAFSKPRNDGVSAMTAICAMTEFMKVNHNINLAKLGFVIK